MIPEKQMSSYRFINTKKFSPVIYEGDLPDKHDYFNLDYKSITKEFLKDGDYAIDTDWWLKQRERCLNGYYIDNAFTEGGDNYIDSQIRYNFENGNDYCIYGGNIIVKDKDVYIKDCDLWIRDGRVYITGRHYFYLNFWKIKRNDDKGIRKIVANPLFTDLSWENWWIRDRMIKEKKDLLFAKRRQAGYSEEEACATAYEFLFYNDSQSVIIAGEDKYNINTMRMVIRGIEALRNTQFFKEFAKGGESEDYRRTKNTGSEIYSRTCKNNSQAISGLSPSRIHYEEIGIWTKGLLREVKATVDPSLESMGNKVGYSTYIGTGGDMEDGVADMEKMAYHPKEYNLLEFENRYEDTDGTTMIARFVPAYRFEIIDKEGNSLNKESILKIEKARNIKDPDERYKNIVMKPIRLSEIFSTKQGGYFGAEITQWCNERKAYILNHKDSQIVKRYRGYWKDAKNPLNGVVMEPDPEGCFMIGEFPKLDKENKQYINLYRGGTDSYDQDEAGYSTSKGACWIKKGFINANETYNIYVAGILERPTTAEGGRELFYEHTAMLCIFYGAINLIEWSNKLIFDWYTKNGFTSLLKMRPEFVTANMVQMSKTTNKYGIDPSTKSDWLVMQKSFLKTKENIEKCDFIELLEAWGRFKYDPSGKKYNCDITIATSLCTVCEEDEKAFTVISSSEDVNEKPLRYTKDKNGNIKFN